MSQAQDPVDLLRALDAAGVKHIVIGGVAVSAHGYVRLTRDLDVVPDPRRANLQRLASALTELEAHQMGTGDFAPEEFPFDPTDADDLAGGANCRLETRAGVLDVMQWVPGLADEAYA